MNEKVDRASVYNIQTQYGQSLLHELIHFAGLDTYSDHELANALYQMGDMKEEQFIAVFRWVRPDSHNV